MVSRRGLAAHRVLCTLALWALVACVPAAGPRAGSAPSAQPTAPPAAATETGTGWEAEWARTLAAAKAEGRVVVSAPVGDVWRRALSAFQEAYPEITLEQSGFNSRDFWPRVIQERRADQYLWDLRIGGPDPLVYASIAEGVMDPVRPLFLLPEVTDNSVWLGGIDALFNDNAAQYLVAFFAYTSAPAEANRDVVSESELRTDEQLLDPRWRGQITVQSPQGGSGLLQLSVLLTAYGEDFLKRLFAQQDVAVTEDSRQQAEWLVRGSRPLAIGTASAQLLLFQQQGLGRRVEPVEGKYTGVSAGVGGIQLLNRAPHPNAAKVFVNWILSRAAQDRLARDTDLNSRRLDVPPVRPERMPDSQHPERYVPTQAESRAAEVERTQQLVQEYIH